MAVREDYTGNLMTAYEGDYIDAFAMWHATVFFWLGLRSVLPAMSFLPFISYNVDFVSCPVERIT